MKRSASFIIVAVLLGIFASNASAQIGKGRLLKKLRDDLFGQQQQQQLSREQAARQAAENQKRLEAQRRAQAEAQKRASTNRQTPTPNRNIQNQNVNRNQVPNRSLQPPTQQNRQQQVSTGNRGQTPRRPTTVRQLQPEPARAKANKPKRVGFGFELVERDEKLFVTQIAAEGNAAEAGIRRGDQIVGIGGVDVATQDGFDDIAEILSNGDNIEIAFRRKGRVDEVQVTFGSIPDVEDPSFEIPSELEASSDRNPDFAPPRNVPTSNASATNRNVQQLERVVQEQQQVISELRRQLENAQSQTGSQATGSGATSVLQSGPTFNGPGR